MRQSLVGHGHGSPPRRLPRSVRSDSAYPAGFWQRDAVRLGELAAELGARRVLVVTDPGIVAAGHLVRARASLESAGLEVTVYDGVRENPTTMDVAQCLAVARDSEVELLVGLGGA